MPFQDYNPYSGKYVAREGNRPQRPQLQKGNPVEPASTGETNWGDLSFGLFSWVPGLGKTPNEEGSVAGEFKKQVTTNPIKAAYEGFTGQLGKLGLYRDTIVYVGAVILLVVALRGVFK